MKFETFQSKGHLLICIRIIIIILNTEPNNDTLYFSAMEFCTTILFIEILTSFTDTAKKKKSIISLKNKCITYPLQILDKKQYLQWRRLLRKQKNVGCQPDYLILASYSNLPFLSQTLKRPLEWSACLGLSQMEPKILSKIRICKKCSIEQSLYSILQKF